jgi:hypothetical protein
LAVAAGDLKPVDPRRPSILWKERRMLERASRRGSAMAAVAVLALLAVLLSGCKAASGAAQGNATPRPQSNYEWVLLDADSTHAVVTRIDSEHGSAITFCVDERGTRLWAFNGVALEKAQALPAGVVAVAEVGPVVYFDKLFVLDASGQVVQRLSSPSESFLPVQSQGDRVTYAATTKAGSDLILASGEGRQRIPIGGPGRLIGVSASNDASRVVASIRVRAGRQLVWLRLRSDGTVASRRIQRTMRSADLSADGRFALLGGEHPKVVRFGSLHGRRLKIDYSGGGVVGSSRLMALSTVGVNNDVSTTVLVCDLRGQTVWETTLPGFARVRCDPDVNCIGYIDPDSSVGVVISLPSLRRYVTAMKVSDMCPIDKDHVAFLKTDGSVVFQRIPF